MRRPEINSFLLFVFCLVTLSASASFIRKDATRNSIRFTENKNQWESRILYKADLDGGSLFLEKNCFTYHIYDKETLRKNHIHSHEANGNDADKIRSTAYRMTFMNASGLTIAQGKDATPDHCNFFIGNDKSRWASDVKNYSEVYYQDLYAGIDLQVLGKQNSIKYNFIVGPDVSVKQIQMKYDGLRNIKLIKGALYFQTGLNEFMEEKPFAFQVINGKQVAVPCRFVLKNNVVSFDLPQGYDKKHELIIDPVLVFACTSGSVADNFGMTATYDDEGNSYAGGTVYGVGYPTQNAFDATWNGTIYNQLRTDVVITKFDATGTFLQYSTYLGGSTSTEVVSSLIVNSQDELMLFGATGSPDFPITTNAFDTTFNGGTNVVFNANGTGYDNGTDLYLAKFSASGSSLLASTFVGGSQNEGTNNSSTLVFNYGDYYRGEIQVDTAGNFYIASCTVSSDFPVTAGCAQPLPGGGMDGVIFKMSPDLSTMIWSTYLGGSADDGCYALTLDNASNIYTTGGTSSTNFPVTAGSFSTAYNGGITDGFITRIANSGSSVINSTFIGTPLYDQGFLIQLDNFYDVYIVGQSLGNMPVSAGAYSNPNSKQFIWKMNANLSSTLITTIFGNGNGQVNISPSAFLVDICGNIYVSGWGGNILTGLQTNGMPITSDAFQPSTDGFNFYLFVLSPDATSLLYGTYFGGALSQEHVDGGTSRFDKKGIVYQAVCANCGGFNATNQHDDFPVTPGSWPNTGGDVNHNTQNYNCNMGVFKFDFQTAGVSADADIFPNDTICAGESIQFNNESANALNYIWDFGDGSPVSTQSSPSHQYPLPGTYNVTLIAIDSTGCLFSDTSDLVVVVAPIPVVDIGNDTIVCQSLNLLLDAGTSGNIYDWSTGDSVQTINVYSPGNYWVEISNGNCNASDTINIQQIILDPDLGNDTNLCAGQTIELNVSEPGVTYLWSTGAATPSIVVSSAGQYWVQVFSGPCVKSDTIIVGYISYPFSTLPASVVICPDDSVLVDPGGPATDYLWSTGDTTQTIYISENGTYSVTISNFQCSIVDSILVQEITFPVLGNDTSVCDGETVILDLSYPGASYLWSTGATTPSITVSTGAEYWGTVMFSGCSGSDTMNISYISYPAIDLPSNITICQNDSVLLDPGGTAESYQWSTGAVSQSIYASSGGSYFVTAANFQCSRSDTTSILQINFPMLSDTTLCDGQSISLDMFFPGANYQWSTNETTSTIIVSSAGQYTVTATLGFCSAVDTAQISFVPYPSISLTDTIDLCPGATQLLDPGAGAGSYLWSTQEQTQTITVSAGGAYYVTGSNFQCNVSDTVIINAIQPVAWEEEVSLCNMVRYMLEAGIQANTYLWSTGETGPSIEIMEEGNYWVVANTGSCVISDTVNITGGFGSGALWFPNSFTPNDNGLNDRFTGIGEDITFFHLMIFNRWGELIYETEKQDQGWDGFYKGSLVQQDVYVWKVKYKTKCTAGKLNSRIGHVTVVK